MKSIISKFLPFWLFLIIFKFGACIHFDLMSVYGGEVFQIWLVGLLMGLASIIQLILDVPAGFILDKFGYKRALMATTLLFMISALFLIFGLNKFTYLFTLFVSSFGWLFFGPGTNAYVLTQATKENVGKFLSIKDMAESIGVILSSAALVWTLSLETKFVGITVISILVLAFLLIFISKKDHTKATEEKKISTHHFYIRRNYLHKIIKTIFRLNPVSIILIFTSLSASTFYAIVWFVFPLMMLGESNEILMGLSLGSFDVAIILTGILIGKLVDKFNKKWLIFCGLLIFSIFGMVLGFCDGLWFVLIGFLIAIGDEMSSVSLWAWLHLLEKDHDEDGLISGVISLFQDLGWAIGPIVGGILYQIIGPRLTMAVGGGLVFIAWLVYSIGFSGLVSGMPNLEKLSVKHPFKHRK